MCNEKEPDGIIEGYGIVFGGPDNKDLQGEYFTPETELCLDGQYPIIVGGKHVGVAELSIDDIGVKAKCTLDLSIPTAQAIIKLVEQGKMFLAPGAYADTEVDSDGNITRFPLHSISVTSAPVQAPQQRQDTIGKMLSAKAQACLFNPA